MTFVIMVLVLTSSPAPKSQFRTGVVALNFSAAAASIARHVSFDSGSRCEILRKRLMGTIKDQSALRAGTYAQCIVE